MDSEAKESEPNNKDGNLVLELLTLFLRFYSYLFIKNNFFQMFFFFCTMFNEYFL